MVTDLENAYYNSIKELKEGEVVKGKIITVTPKEVIVDVGYKSEGVIPSDEFSGLDVANLGEIEVYVENVEDAEGKIILSFRKAKAKKGWQTLGEDYREGDLVEGTIIRRVRGGYMVNVLGVEGFLPQSLTTFRGTSEDEIIGGKFYFQIAKMHRAKENLILSRKDAVRMERELSRKKIWEAIEPGKIVKGKVKSITNFGAFVDLGGVDGLLHITDMSWKKISHPSEVVAVGDELKVVVLHFEREKSKISLGLKQTMPDPWKEIERKYPVGGTVKGRITNIQNYGIFVELEKGIEGLVHISEVSWTKKFINLHEMFAIGDTLEAKVISVEPDERKISLSTKQLEKDPWEDIEALVTIDSILKGKVSNYAEGCAFVELENGLEGIIYSEDVSWTKRVSRLQELLKRGHPLSFKVLGLDRANRKVIVGLKQLKEDPWPAIQGRYPLDTILEAEVVKVTSFGVFVKLEEDLEGLVFSGEIAKELMDSLKPKERLKVKIIKVDPAACKIGLSTKIEEES